MKKRIELWAFIQAFQLSPYKYLYMNLMLEALQIVKEKKVLNLKSYIESRLPGAEYWLQKIEEMSQEIEREETCFLRSSVQFVFYGEDSYPKTLSQISDPPLALSYEGDLSLLTSPAVSIVGAREPHDFSKEWMQAELYTFLKISRAGVISGGARGVDQKAHGMALLLDIPTVVILPTGLNQKYPALWNQSSWSEKPLIFVSEMRLNESLAKKNFSARNRLIAAWGIGTLIVEAHKKSGTLITAHHALIEGRPLWVVPGHPQMSSFAGSLELAFDQAQIVRNASDLCMLYNGEISFQTRLPLGVVQ